MKYVSLFVVVILALCISSCSKSSDSVDAREQFVGLWKGTGTLNLTGYQPQTLSYTFLIAKKSNSDKLLFADTSDAIWEASYSGNTYTYSDSFDATLSGNSYVCTTTSIGTLSGNVITENTTISCKYSTSTIAGTSTATFTRQ